MHDLRYYITLVENATLTPQALEAWASEVKERLGLKQFHLYLTNGDLKLDTLIASQKAQGQGTAAMTALCRFADEHRLRIILTPAVRDDHHGTTSRARLVRFYKRFGFVENKGRHKDFSISAGMLRNPK